MMKNKSRNERGTIIVSILVITVVLTTFMYGLILNANVNLSRSRSRLLLLQAQYASESAADAAIAILNSGNDTYTGTTSDVTLLTAPTYRSTYSVTVAAGSNSKEKIVTATGKVYAPKSSVTPNYTRRIEVTAQRTSTTTSSAIISRNIVYVDSGVKTIKAKDIYLNGFIQMNKNTTDLIAENIIVADKNTGAGNCSIGGTGNLVKPSSFTNPAQTKTRITLGYNNCINPPGNTSNADFDVQANVSGIGKIQSINIPWAEYMDNSYQSSPSGCGDWTSGASPRSIPSTGNTKKTHYPDNSSNVSTSCGSSGDLDLGSGIEYDIRDHIHLRANICAASGCEPIFYNPDSTLKFVFVEGTINFNGVQTKAGSGPIVFVIYGADPASKTSVCPYGGAFYISNTGTTSAPKAFFLANNGVCLDKTKYGSDPAMGGFAGKNIYVATNSGTPFDLELDPAFPVDQIPVDLSWRAVRYRRL
jgi:hypothetical protein